MSNIVEVEAITKNFKNVKALCGIDLTVKAGEFVALLGPNGAGKTTLVEIIEGVQLPTSGSVKVKGMRWEDHRNTIHKLIGLSFQETHFFERVTVFETVRLFASLFDAPKSRIMEMIILVGLEEKKNAYTMHLSGGQRQKLAIAVALINSPELLLLDEPTTGLDPKARREIWNLLMKLKVENQTSMLLTTHYMEEAKFLCDRIIIIDHGKKLMEGTLSDLLKQNGKSNLDDLFLSLTGRALTDEITL